MRLTWVQSVEVSKEEIQLLQLLIEKGPKYNYACDEFPLEIFDSLVRKGLAEENGDGKVCVSPSGIAAYSNVWRDNG